MAKKNPKHRPPMLRHDFDGIANKFDKNIYGTSKGKLRHQLLVSYLEEYLKSPSMKVLDAGAGTGMMAREFLANSHQVHLNDASSDVLDIAKTRVADYEKASFSHTPILNLDWNSMVSNNPVESKHGFDLILCHAMLEWLPDPKAVIDFLVNTLLADGGSLSLSFFNADAMLFNNVLYGNFDYVKAGCKAKNQVRLNPHNPQKPSDIIAFLQNDLGCKVIQSAGIRCFHDYMFDKSKIETEYESLYEMERQFGEQAPYKWVGKYFHLIATKDKTR